MADNAQTIWRFLRGKGLTPAQSAGVIGSLKQESNLSPTVVNSIGATGLAQWLGGRKAALLKQPNPSSLHTQLNYLWSELEGPERGALQKLKTAHSIDDAAAAFTWGFERPGKAEANMANRVAQGRQAFDRLNGVAGAAPAGSSGSSARGGGSSRTVTTTTPGVDNRAARASLIQSFLSDHNSDPVDFAVQARQLQDVPETTTTKTVRIPGAARAAAAGTPMAASGPVHSPVGRAAKVIGTPYAGTHTLGNWQSDNAVDISVPVGTPMVALQDGVVVKVRHHPQNGGRFAGDQITIKGANGNEYFYAHGKAAVKPGQRIRRGQRLGTTGSANGVAHLHFGQERGDPREHT